MVDMRRKQGVDGRVSSIEDEAPLVVPERQPAADVDEQCQHGETDAKEHEATEDRLPSSGHQTIRRHVPAPARDLASPRTLEIATMTPPTIASGTDQPRIAGATITAR